MPQLSRALILFRDLGVGLGLLALILFPLPAVLWQMAGWSLPDLPSRWPLLAVAFQAWDAGAQQPMARALLRCLCALVALCGLFLPAQPGWVRPRWMLLGTVFLGLGGISALLAPHRFQALRDWETWVLAGLVAYTVAAQWRRGPALLGLTYGLTGLTLVHAAVLAIPGSKDRLGGLFHHPNALSTFCLMLLAVTLGRAFGGGRDRPLAQISSGILLGLALCAGSLTGGVIMVGTAAALVPVSLGWPARACLGLLAAASLLAANLSGGWWSILGLPCLLVLLWLLAMRCRPGGQVLAATWGVVLTASLVLLAHSLLAPPRAIGQGSASRRDSGLGRLEFYQSSLEMIAEHPLLGVGPGGFSRDYPGRQTSVDYFSKFPHCLPLEIASEWGLPAAVAFALLLLGAARQATRAQEKPEVRMAGWLLAIFLLHSTTDVQTQFPYLLILAAIALGVIAASHQGPGMSQDNTSTLLTRSLLALGCLALLMLNLGRVSAGFDRTLALAIAQRTQSEYGKLAVSGLLFSSFESDPLDSEAARLWGMALLSEPNQEGAARLADLAVALDPRRASCKLLQLTASPPARQRAVLDYQAAIALDRVNYPTFYRGLAEALWIDGKPEQALEVLRGQAPVYQRSLLTGLFAFRENDLSDQLVEFYAIKAMLEELAHSGAGEPDLRLALQHCDGRSFRLARLRDYALALGRLGEGPLPAKLQLLLDEVPTQQGPAPVEAPLHEP